MPIPFILALRRYPAARRTLTAVILVVQMLAMVSASAAAPGDSLEVSAIKIAFVYNFAKFTEWPAEEYASSTASIHVCVRRSELDIRAVRSIDGKTIRERPIRTLVVGAGDDVSVCDVLFVSRFSSSVERNMVLDAARRHRILVVSDERSFAQNGGHIGLISDKQRLRFQVNLHSVSDAALKLGSGLLQLAEIVDK